MPNLNFCYSRHFRTAQSHTKRQCSYSPALSLSSPFSAYLLSTFLPSSLLITWRPDFQLPSHFASLFCSWQVKLSQFCLSWRIRAAQNYCASLLHSSNRFWNAPWAVRHVLRPQPFREDRRKGEIRFYPSSELLLVVFSASLYFHKNWCF